MSATSMNDRDDLLNLLCSLAVEGADGNPVRLPASDRGKELLHLLISYNLVEIRVTPEGMRQALKRNVREVKQ